VEGAGKAKGAPDFHIVAPSLPGFGFSSAPRNKGFGVLEMAKTVNELMIKLGYPKYVAQGQCLCPPFFPSFVLGCFYLDDEDG
jgi:pimeloyl-ACP methyl ester carboxylesterase